MIFNEWFKAPRIARKHRTVACADCTGDCSRSVGSTDSRSSAAPGSPSRRQGRGTGVNRASALLALALLALPAAALAGPPFLTDDPVPTDIGHWEVYAPQSDMEGSGDEYEGAFGAEINYGAAQGVQLTLGLPVAFAHDTTGTRWGAGDLEASVKYEFLHDEAVGLSIAAFPGVSLPTATNGLGSGRVTAFLPIWAQEDVGTWSVFGGGGYAINPGSGNRNYWSGGVAVARQFGDQLLIGVEADRQGTDAVGGSASTSLGVGAIYDLPGPLRLLASGGPTVNDHGETGYHAYAALGLDF